MKLLLAVEKGELLKSVTCQLEFPDEGLACEL